ncbi:hypothetical protein [Burkholderia vietnamiensis]|uniref:hypothetical protein n=1 Tax=Burkholderia vietnamiensis TaxID=60552 RepID=UPI001CF2F9F6|nr:hypothetical protein [Burkholderia vietnamiensis]MCA8450530.1 hypothetical protein [Burkholderia vietnamiensis]HDR8952684.1 hypothetical protein [Burkholderia vietnamiensis]
MMLHDPLADVSGQIKRGVIPTPQFLFAFVLYEIHISDLEKACLLATAKLPLRCAASHFLRLKIELPYNVAKIDSVFRHFAHERDHDRPMIRYLALFAIVAQGDTVNLHQFRELAQSQTCLPDVSLELIISHGQA